ncbi:MAG: Gfo/Idh/MocA family oxidoreductase [Roseibacillus sp.]|nr:Gfo/Idh/MocA family oxidoreductase [Roseibacillus sp.]
MKKSSLDRRRFLTTGAAASGVWTAAPRILRAQGKVSANDKLNIGVIGSSGQGGFSIGQLKDIANIAALCDVDQNRLAPVARQFPSARTYKDFRKLVEQQDLDAVVVATPDHTHAVASVAAMRADKHVYCEKPLCRTISEVRHVTGLARETNRVTQMGTQIHAGSNYRRVVELVRSGAIGEISEVHVWVGSSTGGRKRYTRFPATVPKNLDWNLWLGPIPEQPYHPDWTHFHWRHWWHFGGGTLADIGCHYMDLPFWALDLSHAISAEAEGPPVDRDSAPISLKVHYQFPDRVVSGRHWKALPLTWYHGRYPDHLLTPEQHKRWGSGILFVGTKGQLISNYGSHVLLPEDKFQGFSQPAPFIQDSKGHHQEWINAIKAGGSTTCRFDYSGPLSETVLLGNVAFRAGKRLEWDAKNMKFPNAPDAEQFLKREYRKGWTL